MRRPQPAAGRLRAVSRAQRNCVDTANPPMEKAQLTAKLWITMRLICPERNCPSMRPLELCF